MLRYSYYKSVAILFVLMKTLQYFFYGRSVAISFEVIEMLLFFVVMEVLQFYF